jgi:hypothetical protein
MERGPGLPSSPDASDDIHSTDPWAAISDRLGVLQVVPDLGPNGPARAAVDVAVGVVAAGGRAVVVSAGGRLVADLMRCGPLISSCPSPATMPLVGGPMSAGW